MNTNQLIEGEPVQAFLDFAEHRSIKALPDGMAEVSALLPDATIQAIDRAINRRALRIRGGDMIRSASDGSPIRSKREARVDAFMELLREADSPAGSRRIR